MADEQQAQGGGEIGKAAAEELKGKTEMDEQQKQAALDDDTYDAQLLAHLEEKLKPEITAFNDQVESADELKLEKGSGMLQLFKDNKPAYAVIVKHRTLHFLAPGSKDVVRTLKATGGPDEYAYLGGTGNAAAMDDEQLLKGLIRLAVGAKFEQE